MPRLPIQRVSLLYLLSEQSYEDDSGKALDVLHSDYTEAFAEYKWNNFYQLFQKLVSEKLAESVGERGKVYLIEITELGREYLSINRRHLPLARKALSETYEPQTPRFLEQTPPQEHDSTKAAEDPLKLVEKTIEVLQSVLEKARTNEESSSKVEELSKQVTELMLKMNRLEARNLQLRAEVESLRAKLPKAKNSLRPSDLPKIWRDLAQKALSQGWTISLTGGEHIRWCSPQGEIYHGSNTPSDHRTVKNAIAALKRMGLKV